MRRETTKMIYRITKWLVWTAAMIIVALAIVYGIYLFLIFMLFNETLYMWLTAAVEVVLFGIYFWLCGVADAL